MMAHGTDCMRIVFLSLLFRLGAGALLATGNFSTTATIIPLTWGMRSSSQNCQLDFPDVTSLSGSYVFMRFNVTVLDFTHYMAFNPNSVTIGPTKRWLLARADYTYTWQLNVVFTFTFDDYLGADIPSGDCTMFTTYAEAVAYANSSTDLISVLPPRLVNTTTFDSAYVDSVTPGWQRVKATCIPRFSDSLGLFEIYIYVYFNMQVFNITSVYGTEFVSTDSEGWWYFGRYQFASQLFLTDVYHVSIPSSATPDYLDGYCSVYALSNDTLTETINVLTAASSTAATTTATATTELGTTVSLFTVATSASDSIPTTTDTLNSTIPTPTNASFTFVIIEAFTHSGQRRMMQEDVAMRNQYVSGRPESWTIGDLNPMTCGRRCLTDPECLSVFFSTQNKTCHGHSVVYSKGDEGFNKTSYYFIV